jgi:hypothetical protein
MTYSTSAGNAGRRGALTAAVVSFALMGILAGLRFYEALTPTEPLLWLAFIGSAAYLIVSAQKAQIARRNQRNLLSSTKHEASANRLAKSVSER